MWKFEKGRKPRAGAPNIAKRKSASLIKRHWRSLIYVLFPVPAQLTRCFLSLIEKWH